MGGHQSPPVRERGRLYSDTCKGGGEGYIVTHVKGAGQVI